MTELRFYVPLDTKYYYYCYCCCCCDYYYYYYHYHYHHDYLTLTLTPDTDSNLPKYNQVFCGSWQWRSEREALSAPRAARAEERHFDDK